jgi:hypothetical protein
VFGDNGFLPEIDGNLLDFALWFIERVFDLKIGKNWLDPRKFE